MYEDNNEMQSDLLEAITSSKRNESKKNAKFNELMQNIEEALAFSLFYFLVFYLNRRFYCR